MAAAMLLPPELLALVQLVPAAEPWWSFGVGVGVALLWKGGVCDVGKTRVALHNSPGSTQD